MRTAAEEDVLRARISKVEGTKEVFEQEHCRLVHAAPRRVQKGHGRPENPGA